MKRGTDCRGNCNVRCNLWLEHEQNELLNSLRGLKGFDTGFGSSAEWKKMQYLVFTERFL